MTLEAFFCSNPRVALAFSGGVDSSYLLYAALKYGVEVRAYYVKSAFQPQFELEDAQRLAQQLGADMTLLSVDVTRYDTVMQNPPDRCYHCKKVIFREILQAAHRDGFHVILDGTNASDDASDRPGMQALAEMEVRSPLRECGLDKETIRRLSREAGLFTWDKPAYACLATRTPTGERITTEKLERTEKAEGFLQKLGLRDFRVRSVGDMAKLQVRERDLDTVMKNRAVILKELKRYYQSVVVDLEER